MKVVIIGAVAAGTSAAAKARRNDEKAEIKVFDMDYDISYSACGLPYYIGTEVETREQLVPRDAGFFKRKYNVDIFTRHQVLDIVATEKFIRVLNMNTGEEFSESFDRLVIATGAEAVIPPIEGVSKSNVFTLRNVGSADRIRDFIIKQNPRKAVITGSGFIGLEMAESLKNRGIDVAMIEMADHVMPSLEKDVAVYLEDYLREKGIQLVLKDTVTAFNGEPAVDKVVMKSGKVLDTDFVILSAGTRPNVKLAVRAGVEIGPTGAIKANTRMQTNIEYIYTCGDCAESYSTITGKPVYRPLGSTANKTGRIAGDQVTGGSLEFRGILGTGIFRVFDMTVAVTGLTESEAIKEGFDVVVCHNIKPDKPGYFKGKEMVIKAVADRTTGRILGAQIVGKSGVDKRIDVFATAITFGATAEDLSHLDLAYAPPFSTSKDPVIYTGMILDNDINRGRKLITANDLEERKLRGDNIAIIDARTEQQFVKSHVNDAVNIPQECLRYHLDRIDRDSEIVTYCNKGVTGNAAQNILLNSGFKKVYNLSGGHENYRKQKVPISGPRKNWDEQFKEMRKKGDDKLRHL